MVWCLGSTGRSTASLNRDSPAEQIISILIHILPTKNTHQIDDLNANIDTPAAAVHPNWTVMGLGKARSHIQK